MPEVGQRGAHHQGAGGREAKDARPRRRPTQRTGSRDSAACPVWAECARQALLFMCARWSACVYKPMPVTSRLDGPRKRELDAGQPAPPVNSDWFVEKWATQSILLLYFYRSCFECTPVTQRGVAGSACLLVLKSALQAAGYQGGCAGEHLVPRGATVWGGSGSAIL